MTGRRMFALCAAALLLAAPAHAAPNGALARAKPEFGPRVVLSSGPTSTEVQTFALGALQLGEVEAGQTARFGHYWVYMPCTRAAGAPGEEGEGSCQAWTSLDTRSGKLARLGLPGHVEFFAWPAFAWPYIAYVAVSPNGGADRADEPEVVRCVVYDHRRRRIVRSVTRRLDVDIDIRSTDFGHMFAARPVTDAGRRRFEFLVDAGAGWQPICSVAMP